MYNNIIINTYPRCEVVRSIRKEKKCKCKTRTIFTLDVRLPNQFIRKKTKKCKSITTTIFTPNKKCKCKCKCTNENVKQQQYLPWM